MPAIRIVLATSPPALRSAVWSAVADHPDLVVVAEACDEVDILLGAADADVAIVGMTGTELPAVAERLLDEYPTIGVLAIDVEGARGLLYRLRPQLTAIDQVTPDGLVEAIRQVAADLAV